jgi:hypothetical protein
MKILSIEAELLHAESDGEAAMTKLIVASRNFVNKSHHKKLRFDKSTIIWRRGPYI